jgi:hypothetical protein
MINYNYYKNMIISIYKVFTEIPGEVYIGHTTEPLNKRLEKHKTTCNYCATKDFKGTKQIELLTQVEIPYELSRIEKNKIAAPIEQLFMDKIPNKNIQNAEWTYEKYLQQRKDEWQRVREKRNKERRERVNCPQCGIELSKGALKRHMRESCKNKMTDTIKC